MKKRQIKKIYRKYATWVPIPEWELIGFKDGSRMSYFTTGSARWDGELIKKRVGVFGIQVRFDYLIDKPVSGLVIPQSIPDGQVLVTRE